jgi:propionate CoA-transferase
VEKVLSAEEAVKLVKDGDTVALGGIGGNGVPEELFLALEERFLNTCHPCALSLYVPGGPGDARGRGLERFAHEGLVKRILTSYVGPLAPNLAKMISDEKIEGYIFPLGVMTQLYGEIAAGRPGLITHIGLHTFIDPRYEGAALNRISKEKFVEVIELDGNEWLFYKGMTINSALIRGTTADERGNITMEKEIGLFDMKYAAMACERFGGKVIAQVERIASKKTLNPQNIFVPEVLVDAIVVAKPENHMQTYKVSYNPAYSGEIRLPFQAIVDLTVARDAFYHTDSQQEIKKEETDIRRVIARRAAMEIKRRDVVALGAGIPEFVADVMIRSRLAEEVRFTVEHGAIGGFPAYGLNFGAALNPDSLMDMPSLHGFYDGGGIDIGFLGMIEIDKRGNVNASMLRRRGFTVGGFINISQGAKRVVFCSYFTQGSEIRVKGGKIEIAREGGIKFVNRVRQITFNGEYAMSKGKEVLVVTDRGVFKLEKEGLFLIEVSPGIDVKRDILANMEFEPGISHHLNNMPGDVFLTTPIHLK